MKRVLLWFVSGFIAWAPMLAQTVVLQPGGEGIDTYVCDCLPQANNPNGPTTALYQGQYGQCFDRILLRWDISSLPPNVVITSAIMELRATTNYGSVGNAGRMVYYRITGDWGETSVTCATIPAYTNEDSVVTGWPVSGQWHAVDVTKFVQKWYADTASNRGLYGFCYGTKGQCDVEYVSSDAAGSPYRPKLTIVCQSASGIEGYENSRPIEFRLDPNYPNPFNPSTRIRYSIPDRSYVTLTVCDIRGHEVLRPVSRMHEPGVYTATIDGSGLSSGVYLCILRAGAMKEVRKMVLMK